MEPDRAFQGEVVDGGEFLMLAVEASGAPPTYTLQKVREGVLPGERAAPFQWIDPLPITPAAPVVGPPAPVPAPVPVPVPLVGPPAFAPELVLETHAMHFSGVEARFQPGAPILAQLRPLLKQLPFAKGSLKLGATEREMRLEPGERWAQFTDAPHYNLIWQGKSLSVAGYNGGPGDGEALHQVWEALYDLAIDAAKAKKAKERRILMARAQRLANAVRTHVDRARNPPSPPGALALPRPPIQEYTVVDATFEVSEEAIGDVVDTNLAWYIKVRTSARLAYRGELIEPARFLMIALDEHKSQGGTVEFLQMLEGMDANAPAAPFAWIEPEPKALAQLTKEFRREMAPRIEEALSTAVNETFGRAHVHSRTDLMVSLGQQILKGRAEFRREP